MRLCALASLRRNEPWSLADPCRCAQWPSRNALQLRSGGWIHSLISIGGVQADRGRPSASAPAKAIELSGESPDRGIRYRPVADGNCVFNRKGGEQPKANEQSVTVL